jgi:tetratricopeptide (TPR) repeat protein
MSNAATVALLIIATATVSPASLQATPTGGDALAGIEALTRGLRFATAIETDDESKGKAQLAIVLTLAEIGAIDVALETIDSVEGWHRGVGYAELASLLAREGRTAEAETLLAKAGEVQEQTPGWQGPRISVYIGKAKAALGDLNGSRTLVEAATEADPRQYTGRAAVTLAGGHARKGDFDGAMGALKELDGAEGVEAAHWRTRGYLTIAGEKALGAEQRLEALSAAEASSASLRGPPRVEVLRAISEQYQKLGEREKAGKALSEAKETMDRSMSGDLSSSMTMTRLARAWATLDDADRARELLREAETTAIRRPLTDRPALLIEIAVTYAALGDEDEYHRLLKTSLEMSDRVSNSRPRALAAVAICRAMGREGLRFDEETGERLDDLYQGLGDPW